MKLIIELTDADAGVAVSATEPANGDGRLHIRRAVRAFLSNDEGQIALLHMSEHGYHKLPGGGIETGENREAALLREIEEELGAYASIGAPIGMAIEQREAHGLLQLSYCYRAKLTGRAASAMPTPEELDSGIRAKWVSPAEAIALLESDQPNNEVGRFIRLRDRAVLLEAIHEMRSVQ